MDQQLRAVGPSKALKIVPEWKAETWADGLISERYPHARAGHTVPDFPPDVTPQEAFDGIACRGEQEEESGDVGQKARCDQDKAGDDDEEAVKEFLARNRAGSNIPLDAGEDTEPLEPGEVRPQDACPKDQQQGVDCTETSADFNEQGKLQDRDDDEHGQENAEYLHRFMIACAA